MICMNLFHILLLQNVYSVIERNARIITISLILAILDDKIVDCLDNYNYYDHSHTIFRMVSTRATPLTHMTLLGQY